MAPEIRPIIICWYEGRSTRSGCILCANFLTSWYTVKFAPKGIVSTMRRVAYDVAYPGW